MSASLKWKTLLCPCLRKLNATGYFSYLTKTGYAYGQGTEGAFGDNTNAAIPVIKEFWWNLA